MEKQAPARRARVDALVEHDQVDAEGFQLGRQRGEMAHAARQPVELHDREHVEAPAAGVREQPIERGAAVLRAAHAVVDVLPGDLESRGLGVAAQGESWASVFWSVVLTRQ